MDYMVCDGFGDALTHGLQEHEARRVAQRMADRRGESVWLYGPEDTDATAEEFTPANSRTMVKNRDGVMLDFEDQVADMDDDIRERLHDDLAPCSPQVFYDAYCAAHLEAFGEEFRP